MAAFGVANSAPSTSDRACAQPAASSGVARSSACAWQARCPQRQRRRRWRQRHPGGGSGGSRLFAASSDKPEWFQALEETAHLDEDVARLLASAKNNPDAVRQRMQAEQEQLYARIMGTKYGGEEAPMEVSFRGPVDSFNLWTWVQLYRPPSGTDLEMMQEVLNSWFLLGRLGGFNSGNLQVLYNQEEGLEELEYDNDEEGAQMSATFHEMGPLEAQGSWLRFWLDMGTADELALDVLINALTTFSKEQLGIKSLIFGGENEDWPAPQRDEFLPEVTMDPMRGPRRMDGRRGMGDDDEEEEDEFEDEQDPFMP